MNLVEIYQCFCDRTRLRILQLLARGPLCVCHFQEILNEPQVKISKHLSYLRTHKMVKTRRQGNFIIYALPEKIDTKLERHLQCLQDSVQTDAVFRSDMQKLGKIQKSCCKPAADLPRNRRVLVAVPS